MERRECPECGNRTYNDVCDLCGNQIPDAEDLTAQTGKKQPAPWIQNITEKWFRSRLEVSWIAGLTLFVLMCLFSVAMIISGPENLSRHLLYDKAGTGKAANLPQIEAQEIYNADGVTVTVNSVGLLNGKVTLTVTVVNKSFERHNVDIKAVTVDNTAVSSFRLKSTYAENVGYVPRAGVTGHVPQRSMSVGMWGIKRGYLVLNLENISDLDIHALEEIALDLLVSGAASDQTRVVANFKTSASE